MTERARTLWLLTSITSLAASLLVMVGSMTQDPPPGVEYGAALSLALAALTFLHWLALGDQKRRRREARRHNIQSR
ncbi:hypothetical protein MARCHEWKA_00570 [Brevundimonas phage vB_BpoS-Marchewka]|uniref:Uncharacterized protein n=1 Tax=Brevundimonas phage vB_BpoS-Marchewka TaxID=2948604 RepID=A0A9E7N470_9CAUD|nr:hypothetical protein MARCHEWKA_00570 [Brevundimonas phage vB_BpoS-Marchewka]